MTHIPPLNAITADAGIESPEYDDSDEERRYMLLYPCDYQEHGSDMAGNVALLLNRENAKEVRALANEIIRDIDAEVEE